MRYLLLIALIIAIVGCGASAQQIEKDIQTASKAIHTWFRTAGMIQNKICNGTPEEPSMADQACDIFIVLQRPEKCGQIRGACHVANLGRPMALTLADLVNEAFNPE